MNASDVLRPQAAGFAQRLPRLSAAAGDALRALFARPLEWRDGDGVLRLQAHPPAPAEVAVLESPEGPARLSIASDAPLDDIGERAWWDYAPPSRALAWALAHESLLGRLGRLLGSSLQPVDLVSIAPGAAPLRLGWQLHEAGAPRARGCLQADAETWQRWIARAQAQDSPLPPQWQAWPLALELSLRLPGFPLAELRATACGDVLVLGSRARIWSSLRLQAGRRAWLAAWDGGCLRALGVASPFSPVESAMSDESALADSDAKPPSSEDRAVRALLDALPLELSFQLGCLELTAGEIARIAPGYVFELPHRLDRAEVLLQAGGRVIGRGELVAVGDTLGVQVLELRGAPADGLQ